MNVGPRTIEKLDRIAHKYRCKLCLPPFRNRLNLFMDARRIKPGTELKLCREVRRLDIKPTIHGSEYSCLCDFDFIELK